MRALVDEGASWVCGEGRLGWDKEPQGPLADPSGRGPGDEGLCFWRSYLELAQTPGRGSGHTTAGTRDASPRR